MYASHINWVQGLLQLGRFAEAEPLAREAAAVSSRLLGPTHEHTALMVRLLRRRWVGGGLRGEGEGEVGGVQ